jgi:hypothetical protein
VSVCQKNGKEKERRGGKKLIKRTYENLVREQCVHGNVFHD